VKINYTGPKCVTRQVAHYEWSAATAFTQEVMEAPLIAELLTAPELRFVLATDEPLTQIKGIGEQGAIELALAGIATVAALATLDNAGLQRLAALIHGSGKQIRAWRAQAQVLVGGQ